jgi:hypothetical protein
MSRIDSVIIRVMQTKLKFSDIKPGQKDIVETAYVNKDGRGEGAITISIYFNGSLRNSGSFGYFSSPDEIKSEYSIRITKDFKFRED